MSFPLVAAAALTIGIAAAHSVLGERLILRRLMRRDLPALFGSDLFTKRTLRFAWHLTTVAWLGLAAVLLILAREVATAPPDVAVLTSKGASLEHSMGAAITITFGVTAVVTAWTSRLRHFAWPVFAAIAVLTWIGA